MPKVNEEEMIIDLWNNYKAKTHEQAEKFLEIIQKALTK